MAKLQPEIEQKSQISPPKSPRSVTFKLRSMVVGVVILVVVAGLVGYKLQTIQYGSANFASLNQLRDVLKSKFDGSVSDSALLDGAKQGLVAATGDPYTEYLTAKDAKALNDDLAGSLSGIGAELAERNNALTVIAPIAGTPAAKAGLLAGDVIVKIDGNDPTGLTLDQAVSKIRGKAGTKVTLTIVRGTAAPQDIAITRANLTIPSVTWKKDGDVGIITISQFGSDTGSLTQKAATDLLSQGATKFVLDLRDNPGGYLQSAVDVSSVFMSGKSVVSERTNGKTVDSMSSTSGGLLVGKPLVVLINGGSASASEITAGALHDNGVAKLVGVQSFGKGSVQQIMSLAGGAEIKVTVAHWYTPDGININKKGIAPDEKVTISAADLNAGNDPQLAKAESLLGN